MTSAPSPSPVVSAEFAAAAAHTRELPPPLAVEVAFAGRSNVGKSTLLNLLMNRQGLARTSSTPGCTRTINFFSLRTREGATLSFVDLPGYGFARRGKDERMAWAELAEGYLLGRASLALVLVLCDARRGLEHDDTELLKMIETSGRSGRRSPGTLVVATKLDKLPLSGRKPALAALQRDGRRVFGVSASDPKSIADLWRRIISGAGLELPPSDGPLQGT
jgi:GTP-binding protein